MKNISKTLWNYSEITSTFYEKKLDKVKSIIVRDDVGNLYVGNMYGNTYGNLYVDECLAIFPLLRGRSESDRRVSLRARRSRVLYFYDCWYTIITGINDWQ